MRKIISTLAAGVLAASGLVLIVGGAAQATEDESCRHYSWTGGPLEEGQIPPRAPGEGWQANTHQEPHGDRATWVDGKPGLHYTGTPGRANWFDFVCEPQPCPTVTIPGPTITATVTATATETAPGPTVTETVTSPPDPAVTETVTATATAKETVTATATVTATSVIPGPTLTLPGPTVMATETASTCPVPVVTETEYAVTSSVEDDDLAKTGANLGTLGWASLLIAAGTALWAFATRRRGAHE